MSEEKKVEEFPKDPETDAMYTVAATFFVTLREAAVKKGADQDTLDHIDQQAAEVARYRKEDTMISELLAEGQAALNQDGPDPEIDGLEETFMGWIGELRDRRRREAFGYTRMVAHTNGNCEGCEGCG